MAALRDKTGSDLLVPREVANILQSRYPSRVWWVTAGFVQRLHLLRHAPSTKMREFLLTATPIKARRRSTAEYKHWVNVITTFCEHVYRSCVSCGVHGYSVSRKAGIGVPKAYMLGCVDVFALDYQQRLCALCIVDAEPASALCR